jgi:hypothetical protein
MVTTEDLEQRRAEVEGSPDLSALLDRLGRRVARLLERPPRIPEFKAQLSSDGGVCPADGAPLLFDPWQPESHRCSRCGKSVSGLRCDRFAARFQHLWLSERIAELAAVGVLAANDAATALAGRLLEEYGSRYHQFPNRDNVLGPSRLFFSTYLESIWLCNVLAGSAMLREAGALDPDTESAVSGLAEEAANLIGEFDEGLSNRQTWNNAALAAAAVWFEDEDLARRALEGQGGLVGHLADGFGEDGLWYEGENYHLFALRGLLTGLGWARAAGVDLFADEISAARLAAALRGPTITALPDLTFPARRDARFGVSLAQPMYLELWEIGIPRLRAAGHEALAASLDGWLAGLYTGSSPKAEVFDSYLHEAGEPEPEHRSRADLSWWSLLEMANELPVGDQWDPQSTLLESQGLAILRAADRYASLEAGSGGGGHGHPDRLNLTLHADGVYWLPDPGTGSYVSRDLFWYRSTLAHNAPRLDGVDQPFTDAQCEAFETRGPWSWAMGRFGGFSRILVAGPEYLLDIVEFSADEERLVELAWHPAGEITLHTGGSWERSPLDAEFLDHVERFVPDAEGPISLTASSAGHRLAMSLVSDAEFFRADCPGLPNATGRSLVFLQRKRGRYVRWVTLLVPGADQAVLRAAGPSLIVTMPEGEHVHRAAPDGWLIETPGGKLELRGRRRAPARPGTLRFDLPLGRTKAHGSVPHVLKPPALDGTLAGFDRSAPLLLDHDDQYRRSEEPYPGAEQFSATAYVNWDEEHLYLAVDVTKADPTFHSPAAAPLALDNEPDAVNSDGLQVYWDLGLGAGAAGLLITPDPRGTDLAVQGVEVTADDPSAVSGAWRPTEGGYCVTVAITIPEWRGAMPHEPIRFDLIVNEMHEDRERRAGQLVWSGGGGWVYLRGDRQDPARFGVLEIA